MWVCFGSLMLVVGFLVLCAPLWSAFFGFTPHDVAAAYALSAVIACGYLGGGAVMIISTIKGHLDLYPDAIETISGLPFWNRRLERKDIGAKMTTSIYVRTYILYPRTRKQRPLTIGMMGSEDEYYRQWMESIPEADKDFFRKRR